MRNGDGCRKPHPRGVAVALVLAALAPGIHAAGGDPGGSALPPALATYVERMQLEADFRECVDAGVKRQGLSDADLIRRIAAEGIAEDVYAAVSVDADEAPDEMLRAVGFVPAHADPDEALAEKALALAKTMLERRTATEDGSLTSTRAFDHFFVGVNRAVDAGCEVPAHLLPGGDALRQQAEAIAPLLAEADRVNQCAASSIAAQGIDEDAAFARLGTQGLAEFRDRALQAARGMAGLDGQALAGLETTEQPARLGRALMLLSATTFELESMARASGLNAIYLDRALGGTCNPSSELQTFIGAVKRANP